MPWNDIQRFNSHFNCCFWLHKEQSRRNTGFLQGNDLMCCVYCTKVFLLFISLFLVLSALAYAKTPGGILLNYSWVNMGFCERALYKKHTLLVQTSLRNVHRRHCQFWNRELQKKGNISTFPITRMKSSRSIYEKIQSPSH